MPILCMPNRLGRKEYGFSKSMSHIKNEISKLYQLFEENRNYEYEIENYDNSKTTVLLGNSFRQLKNLKEEKDSEVMQIKLSFI